MSDSIELQGGEIKITVDSSAVKPAMDKVKSDVKSAVPDVEASANKIENALKKLKAETGRRSELGEIGELLKGAGAVAGVTILGEVLKNATGKAAELSTQFREGKINSQQMALGVAESIPVLGSFVESLSNIGELINGTKAAQENHKAMVEETNQRYIEQQRILQENLAIKNKEAEEQIALNSELAVASAPAGIKRQLAGLEGRAEEQGAKEDESAQQKIDEHIKTTLALRQKYREELEKYQKMPLSDRKRQLGQELLDMESQGAQSDEDPSNDAVAQGYLKTAEAHKDIHKKAIDIEKKKIESGNQELIRARERIEQMAAQNMEQKIEAFSHSVTNAGYTGDAAKSLVDAKREELKTQASVDSGKALESLNKQFADSGAITAAQKIKVFNDEQDHLVAKGELSVDLVGQIKNAFARNLGAEKVNELNNELNRLTENETQVGKIGLERQVAQWEAAASAAKALGDNTGEAVAKVLELKAAQASVGDQLGQAKETLAQSSMNPIEKSTDKLNSLVFALDRNGVDTTELRKQIAELNATEKQIATNEDVKHINEQRNEVGMNPLEKAKYEAGLKGEDTTAVGAAQGKLLGAQLAEELKSPIDKMHNTLDYYKQLLQQGDISQKQFSQLSAKAFQSIVDANAKPMDIDTAAKDRIARQMVSLGMVMPAVDKINSPNNTKNKDAKEQHKENTKAVAENTKAVIDLNSAITKGILAVYA